RLGRMMGQGGGRGLGRRTGGQPRESQVAETGCRGLQQLAARQHAGGGDVPWHGIVLHDGKEADRGCMVASGGEAALLSSTCGTRSKRTKPARTAATLLAATARRIPRRCTRRPGSLRN